MFSVFRKKRTAGATRVKRSDEDSARRLRMGLRWGGLMLVIGSVTALYWNIQPMMREPVLPLKEVSIDGDLRYQRPEQLETIIKQNMRGGYFSVDLASIRQAVKSLPWIEEVRIRRVWPDGLHFDLTEKQVLAYWGDKALLSRRGEVFEPEIIPRGLPVPDLSGPAGTQEQVWQFANHVSDRLATLGMVLRNMELDERRAWKLEIDQGFVLNLGRRDPEMRLQRFERVFSMRNAPSIEKIAEIDMRYPNGFAVEFNGQEQTSIRVTEEDAKNKVSEV